MLMRVVGWRFEASWLADAAVANNDYQFTKKLVWWLVSLPQRFQSMLAVLGSSVIIR
jgi:hypothetical protein